MKMPGHYKGRSNRTLNAQRPMLYAFTLIELLVVIAIIAILAAILFPVFATVRESTRQGSAMSNMHAAYLGARLFYEDESRYPNALFGYAEVALPPSSNPNDALARLMKPSEIGTVTPTPMDKATGNFYTNPATGRSLNNGYLYREQVKDFETFLDPDNLVGKRQDGKTQVTTVRYPLSLSPLKKGTSLAGQNVAWSSGTTATPTTCPLTPDTDLPADPAYSAPGGGLQKVYYKMDSMDIGPAINLATGEAQTDGSGNVIYELHYSPDWTQQRYDPKLSKLCDEDTNGNPLVAQLKYKNPPTERTILTYITDHVATAHSKNVLILLMSGTARTMDYKQALDPNSTYALPLRYH